MFMCECVHDLCVCVHACVCRYAVRIEAMQLGLEFKEKVADIQPAIATLDTVMDELLQCDKLTELFHVALIAGNVINGVRKPHPLCQPPLPPLDMLYVCVYVCRGAGLAMRTASLSSLCLS